MRVADINLNYHECPERDQGLLNWKFSKKDVIITFFSVLFINNESNKRQLFCRLLSLQADLPLAFFFKTN